MTVTIVSTYQPNEISTAILETFYFTISLIMKLIHRGLSNFLKVTQWLNIRARIWTRKPLPDPMLNAATLHYTTFHFCFAGDTWCGIATTKWPDIKGKNAENHGKNPPCRKTLIGKCCSNNDNNVILHICSRSGGFLYFPIFV